MSSNRFPSLQLVLPDWIESILPPQEHVFADFEERVALVTELSRLNVQHGGGPFGAAIFDQHEGTLLAPGVNLVVPTKWSGAHAEMVAIAVAQQAIQSHDLGASKKSYELVTSCEPCSMCFGAIPWSGVRRLVCGARGSDAEAIGFDEGPKRDDWAASLRTRGIEVLQDVLRDQARAVLQEYATQGGEIYNGRRGD